MKKLFTFLLIASLYFANAQNVDPNQPKPINWFNKINYTAPAAVMPEVDVESYLREDAQNAHDKSKPWRFGAEIPVNLDPNNSGQWTNLSNGDKVWLLNIQSLNATSINLLFDWYNLPEGNRLNIYNNDRSFLHSELSHLHNNEAKTMATWLVQGDNIWVEYFVPSGNSLGELEIGTVVHGYRTEKMFADAQAKALNDSGACNHDVDCDISPIPDPFGLNQVKEDVKKSVAMIVLGGGLCTGALVNNTNNDGTPYFLTANHCLGGVNSWAFRFNWRSPNPSCGTTANSTNGTFNQTAAGAILRASNSNSDMALLQITDQAFFNGSPDVVWAGWDRSTTAVPSTVFGVHHPSGDIQKTCREDQSPTRTTNNFNGNPNTRMWRVADWDLGVTEPGSSGSPLFNQDGRIIGKLSGGAAACSGTNDNGGFDIYGRFETSWDFGTANNQQLKFWLDPAGTNPITLDRFPPLQVFNNDAQIVIQNVDNELCDETINPTLVLTNRGAQNLTSATITWELNSNGPQTINFTGNLATDQSINFNIGPLTVNPNPGVQTLAVSVTSPNGVPDENTNNDSGLITFELLPDFDTTTVTFNLLTDNFGEETSYELRNSSGAIVASGPTTPFADNTQFNIPMPVVFDECYTFTIFDSFGDGICCGFGIGNYSLTTDNATVIFSSNGNFSSAESTSFRIKQTLSIGDFDLNDFSVYPNPSADIFRVSFPSGLEQLNFAIYDITGRSISAGTLNENNAPIDLSSQASGVYFIQFNIEGTRVSKKLIKL